VPIYLVDQPARPLFQPGPKYVLAGKDRKLQDGSVKLRYTIGASGRVIPGSIRILDATHRDYIEGAAAVIERSKFEPARAKNCKVPEVVIQRLSWVSE
jgi:hypothetical protein